MAESDFGVPLPALFGHELAGIVKEIGPDVSEFQVGDHVVGSLIHYFGHGGSCLEGRTYQCEHPEETLRGADDTPRLSRAGEPVPPLLGPPAVPDHSRVTRTPQT